MKGGVIVNKFEIYEALKSTPGVHETSNGQLVTRCFICGDSKKNQNKKRLGIKVDVTNPSEPVLYHCFNCNAAGLFTPEMLTQLGIENRELSTSLRKLNNTALHDTGSKVNRYKNTREIDIQYPKLYKNDRTLSKIRYLYDRVGKIPIEEFSQLKIVVNLDDFLRVNGIPPTNRFTDIISTNYIGFLSVNNEFIIFRDITGKQKMRYIKYNIFDVKDNSNSFYAMKTSVDAIGTEPIHLCIAEGIFDIISVRYNILHGDIKNHILMASCNSSFTNPLKYFIRKGLVGSNIFIDCYQDNDTKLNFKKIKSEFTPFICDSRNFKVYYNTLHKDFGYPESEIIIDQVSL